MNIIMGNIIKKFLILVCVVSICSNFALSEDLESEFNIRDLKRSGNGSTILTSSLGGLFGILNPSRSIDLPPKTKILMRQLIRTIKPHNLFLYF